MFELRFVLPLGWRALVIPIHMFSMIPRSPSPRIAAEPRAVGVEGAVIPVVPREHGTKVSRFDLSDATNGSPSAAAAGIFGCSHLVGWGGDFFGGGVAGV